MDYHCFCHHHCHRRRYHHNHHRRHHHHRRRHHHHHHHQQQQQHNNNQHYHQHYHQHRCHHCHTITITSSSSLIKRALSFITINNPSLSPPFPSPPLSHTPAFNYYFTSQIYKYSYYDKTTI